MLDPKPILDQEPGQKCKLVNVEIDADKAARTVSQGFFDMPVLAELASGYVFKFRGGKENEVTLQKDDVVTERRVFRLFIFCDKPKKQLLFEVKWGYEITITVGATPDATTYSSTVGQVQIIRGSQVNLDEDGAQGDDIDQAVKNGSTQQVQPLGTGKGINVPTLKKQ